MPLDPDQFRTLTAALARRARSHREAKQVIARMEAARDELCAGAEPSSDDLGACDLFMLSWAHRNAAYVNRETYERLFERVEARQPLGRVRRLFTLGKLPRISRLVTVFKRHPPGLLDPMSTTAEMRELAEIELLDELPAGITSAGLRPGDRLVVHIGSQMYQDALAIVSLEAPSERPEDPGMTILLAGRIIAYEADDRRSPYFVSIELLLCEGDPATFVIPPGEARIECVIFNRADVLARLPVQ
jgi:hypothetical protein